MTKRLLLLVSILALLILSGCLAEANLKVTNNSAAYVTVWLGSGYQMQHIQPNGHAFLSIPALQSSQIYYEGAHIKPGNIFIESEGSGTKYLQLNPDCGALKFINSSSRDVREINVRQSGSSVWSSNKINNWLLSGQETSISLDPGFWEFRVRDGFNDIHYITSQEIKLDITTPYNFFSVR